MMKKRILSILLALTLCLSLLPTAVFAETSVHEIGSADELVKFASEVNDGTDYAGMTVKLTADITLTGDWAPIGNGNRSGSGYTGSAFKGTFDGDNHTITGLTIKSTSGADAALGLFGVVDGGTVKNLKLDGVKINVASSDLVGAAIGLMVGGAKAENITVSGSVTGNDGVGGIVGRMTINGTIKDCENSAAVTASKAGKGTAGGIVGKAYYTETGKEMVINGCKNFGVITAAYAAGGMVGFSAATVYGCINEKDVTAGNIAGGIIGEQTNYGSVYGNINTEDGTVSNTEDSAGSAYGGIVGWIRYQNSDSYARTSMIRVFGNTNYGTISASKAKLGTGGVVGTAYNQADVTGNSNGAASITGGTFTAGILGGAQKSAENKSIEGETIKVYNNVSTTAATSLKGEVEEDKTACVDLYMWNNEASTFKAENNSSAWVAAIGDNEYATLAAAIAVADGKTVKLLNDITLAYGGSNTITIPAGKDITLDLNGKKINSAAGRVIDVRGKLTIVGDGEINGATVEQQKIDSDSDTRDYYNGYQVIDVNGANAKLTMASGTINAYGKNGYGMYGITVKNDASVVLGDADGNGPTVNAYCAAVGTNNLTGTADVTIKGGTYTTEVAAESPDEDGAYFCAAIYAATPGTYNIQGGTFVGYYGFSARYKDAEQQINISGGDFNGKEAALFVGDVAGSTSGTRTLSITGGYFTTDPSAYVADNYYVHMSDKTGYTYMVTNEALDLTHIEENTAASLGSGVTVGSDAQYADKLDGADVTNVGAALDTSDLYNALENDAQTAIDAANFKHVEVKVAVTVTAADLDSEGEGTMTFTATPTADIYASGVKVASGVAVTNAMLNGKPITVALPLPEGFVPKQIKHISSNGSVEYFINETEGSKRGAKTFEVYSVDAGELLGTVYYATFEITHFSEFVLTGTVDYVEPAIPSSKPANDVDVKGGLNGSVSVNHDSAREGTIVTVTVNPNAGYVLDSLTVTDQNGKAITVTHVSGNKYSFIMPDGKVTVRASFTDGTATGFVDVPADKYFYDAVNWAVANGITSGKDATHFAPYASCTRGQLVTFLWRAAGQPAAKSSENPFSDVSESSSFYKAILWAAENGIVTGYSDGTFKPNAAVSRQQTAAILYRYAKYAKMDVSVGEDTNILSFNDAFSVSEYAVSAFQWAVGEGVITGNGANLLPHDTCTRAQIVTMLYRLLAK